jgi:RsiW-degrading membrane proteinase PrsW (M82 family)
MPLQGGFPTVPLVCAVSGIAWAALAAWRARESPARLAARALLGGAAAFGLAFAAYELAPAAGLDVRWERIAAGDLEALALATLAGLTEEGAKLAGILLVAERRSRPAVALAASAGVAAGFAALEGMLVLHGSPPFPAALARATLGPVAHATLAVPVAFGVAAALRFGGRAWVLLLPALGASAALHAGANLSLALPERGQLAHAFVLLGPALWVFARARRPAPEGAGLAVRSCAPPTPR